MAVFQVTKASLTFMGYSQDPKPLSPPPGSTFQELNSGKKWIFDGANWVEDVSMVWSVRQALLNAQ